jgi:hypothetical protein
MIALAYPQSSVPALLQNSGPWAIGYRHIVEIGGGGGAGRTEDCCPVYTQ